LVAGSSPARPTVFRLVRASRKRPRAIESPDLPAFYRRAAGLAASCSSCYCIALNAACTHRNEAAVRRHISGALDAGATDEEIRDTLKGVSVLGIHAVAVSLPILLDEAAQAGTQPKRRPAVDTPVIDQVKAAGLFNPAWDVIYELDPEWLEQFIAMGADLYRGVLPRKLVELMAIAADASCTHLYTPGIRRHIHDALAHGATIAEIMEVLKLCGAQGVDACELGAPLLAEELAKPR